MSAQDYIYCYQGSALRVGSGNVVIGKVFDPYDPSTIPDHTIRCRFTQGFVPHDAPSYHPLTTKNLVVPDQNIWDITRESSDWAFLLLTAGGEALIEVLGAKSSCVTNMSGTFRDCTLLESVALFDTSSVISMGGGEAYGMFKNCSSLTTVPLFDTSSCTNMSNMFYGSSLTSVPLFDTSSCTNMRSMFYNCSDLTTVPLFDTSSCTDMSWMFSGCTNVQSGALALYQQASTQSTPPSAHSGCFYKCGSNTVTGAAELAQIPTSWGGTMAE